MEREEYAHGSSIDQRNSGQALCSTLEVAPIRVITAGGGSLGGKDNSWSIAFGLSAIFMDSLPLRRHKNSLAMFA